MYHSWNLSYILLILLRLWVGVGRPQKGNCHFHYNTSTVHTISKWFMNIDVDLDYLADVVFFRFLHCKLNLLPTFYTVPFRRKSLSQPEGLHRGVRSYAPPGRGRSIYTNLEFCTDLSLFSHLLLYLIIYLYQYGLMDCYFILWAVIQ